MTSANQNTVTDALTNQRSVFVMSTNQHSPYKVGDDDDSCVPDNVVVIVVVAGVGGHRPQSQLEGEHHLTSSHHPAMGRCEV